MALSAGTRLGSYEIVRTIGAGGMGEVYRARDTVLDRDVALKILPEAFASDPDRLMRFEREAKTLATLNHPHVAHIHGLEVSGGTRALVMELVEGDDLSQRLARGPLPIEDAVPIAVQVAEALEAAHEQGIIHRDLKPANIKVKADGTVKVLDFGLAKALESGPRTQDPGPRKDSGPGTLDPGPTMTSPALTQLGVILGTAAYMSPEQARGRPVDRRADIWAFGCVLYEMLTGRRAFAGDELTDVIAAVVTRDPDLTALPADTPPHVRALLARCFVKDQKQRMRDIGEARLQLTDATPAVLPGASSSPASSSRSWAVPVLAVLLVGALATVATLLWRDGNRPAVRSTHVSLTFLDAPQPQKGRPIPSLAVSPDGRTVVYTARGPEGNQLWIRSLDGFKGTPIPGTVNGRAPVFSPDGRWIAYEAQGQIIMKISTAFDRPIVVAEPGALVSGLTWTDRDDIVFGTVEADALWRVPASGGAPVKVADGYFGWPGALPGGSAVVATTSNDAATRSDGLTIARIDLETGAVTSLIDGGTYARWIPGGYLAFVRGNSLVATTYDPSTNALGEMRVAVAEDLFMDPAASSGCYAVSPAGVLVFCPGGGIDFDRTIVAIDPARPGTTPASVVDRARYYDSPLAASPDGQFVAAIERGWHDRIVIIDLERRTSFYLTASAPRESQVSPVWSPDGRTIAYREGRRILKTEVSDGGGGTPDMLVDNVNRRLLYLTAWTPDGRSLIADEGGAVVRIAPGQAPPFETLVDNAGAGVFSPDGRWLAVQSARSGQNEVYVAPAANPGALVRVSLDGGGVPMWAPRGNRLYFQGGGPSAARKIMAVNVGSGGEPQVGRPTPVAVVAGVEPSVSVAPLPDGRLLAIQGSHMADAPELRVVLNWFDELKTKVK